MLITKLNEEIVKWRHAHHNLKKDYELELALCKQQISKLKDKQESECSLSGSNSPSKPPSTPTIMTGVSKNLN